MTLDEFMKDGRYLPRFMRDFHDCKDLFKTLHRRVDVKKHPYAGSVSWDVGQCYVVDIFLWYMAKHGYTLQRTRTQFEHPEITDTVKETMAAIRDEFFKSSSLYAPSMEPTK